MNGPRTPLCGGWIVSVTGVGVQGCTGSRLGDCPRSRVGLVALVVSSGMAILILQHSDIGIPGRFGATLRDHGFKLEFSRADLPTTRSNPGVPADLDGVEGVVILGGPQNVTDAASHPWMQSELELIKHAHARELPLIGICLGAQMIAQALGGAVGFRATPGLGFDTLRLSTVGQIETIFSGIAWNHPQFFSCEQEVQKLPPGAAVLASTKSASVGAFRVGLRTFGFLFHPECDQEGLKTLARSSSAIAGKAGVNPEFVDKQISDQYQTYARLSDRLAHNVVTYCFPLERRQTA